MPDGTSRLSLGGKKLHHYMGTSTFAQYTVLPEIALARIRDDAPFDKVCYIGCGVTTGIGAVLFTAKVEPGSRVVVFGLGGIGLNVIQGAWLAGAAQIVGVDINPARRPLAERFGLAAFVNPAEVEGDLVPYLVHLTRGGAAGEEISTRPFQLVTGRNWRGSAFGGARGRTDLPRLVDWYMEGRIAIDEMITHTLTLEDINRGFELMQRSESIRSVVVY